MEFSDSLCLVLRCGLVGLFFLYYGLALGLSVRLHRSQVRTLILRGAVVPILAVAAISATYIWFKTTEGYDASVAFLAMVAVSVAGAVAFSLWLQRGGGKQMLYVPVAFARFGWDEQEVVTYAVADLSAEEPRIGNALFLSVLPMLIMLLALLLVLWDTSRSVG